jgi:hypothetical protein
VSAPGSRQAAALRVLGEVWRAAGMAGQAKADLAAGVEVARR